MAKNKNKSQTLDGRFWHSAKKVNYLRSMIEFRPENRPKFTPINKNNQHKNTQKIQIDIPSQK